MHEAVRRLERARDGAQSARDEARLVRDEQWGEREVACERVDGVEERWVRRVVGRQGRVEAGEVDLEAALLTVWEEYVEAAGAVSTLGDGAKGETYRSCWMRGGGCSSSHQRPEVWRRSAGARARLSTPQASDSGDGTRLMAASLGSFRSYWSPIHVEPEGEPGEAERVVASVERSKPGTKMLSEVLS